MYGIIKRIINKIRIRLHIHYYRTVFVDDYGTEYVRCRCGSKKYYADHELGAITSGWVEHVN